jgi:hypothetical protein
MWVIACLFLIWSLAGCAAYLSQVTPIRKAEAG